MDQIEPKDLTERRGGGWGIYLPSEKRVMLAHHRTPYANATEANVMLKHLRNVSRDPKGKSRFSDAEVIPFDSVKWVPEMIESVDDVKETKMPKFNPQFTGIRKLLHDMLTVPDAPVAPLNEAKHVWIEIATGVKGEALQQLVHELDRRRIQHRMQGDFFTDPHLEVRLPAGEWTEVATGIKGDALQAIVHAFDKQRLQHRMQGDLFTDPHLEVRAPKFVESVDPATLPEAQLIEGAPKRKVEPEEDEDEVVDKPEPKMKSSTSKLTKGQRKEFEWLSDSVEAIEDVENSIASAKGFVQSKAGEIGEKAPALVEILRSLPTPLLRLKGTMIELIEHEDEISKTPQLLAYITKVAIPKLLELGHTRAQEEFEEFKEATKSVIKLPPTISVKLDKNPPDAPPYDITVGTRQAIKSAKLGEALSDMLAKLKTWWKKFQKYNADVNALADEIDEKINTMGHA